MSKIFSYLRWLLLLTFAIFASLTNQVSAATVSFLIDPATIDNNPADGFITGNEFSPIGSDGTVFTMLPTNNLVGMDRFLLDPLRGLHFGGGGGSTLSFDFSVDRDIQLENYTLSNDGFFLGNPVFDIREGANILSTSNTAISSGDTHAFTGGPVMLSAGTNYTFIATTTGAAIQSYMSSWEYSATVVPLPAAVWLLGSALGLVAWSTRLRK